MLTRQTGGGFEQFFSSGQKLKGLLGFELECFIHGFLYNKNTKEITTLHKTSDAGYQNLLLWKDPLFKISISGDYVMDDMIVIDKEYADQEQIFKKKYHKNIVDPDNFKLNNCEFLFLSSHELDGGVSLYDMNRYISQFYSVVEQLISRKVTVKGFKGLYFLRTYDDKLEETENYFGYYFRSNGIDSLKDMSATIQATFECETNVFLHDFYSFFQPFFGNIGLDKLDSDSDKEYLETHPVPIQFHGYISYIIYLLKSYINFNKGGRKKYLKVWLPIIIRSNYDDICRSIDMSTLGNPDIIKENIKGLLIDKYTRIDEREKYGDLNNLNKEEFNEIIIDFINNSVLEDFCYNVSVAKIPIIIDNKSSIKFEIRTFNSEFTNFISDYGNTKLLTGPSTPMRRLTIKKHIVSNNISRHETPLIRDLTYKKDNIRSIISKRNKERRHSKVMSLRRSIPEADKLGVMTQRRVLSSKKSSRSNKSIRRSSRGGRKTKRKRR